MIVVIIVCSCGKLIYTVCDEVAKVCMGDGKPTSYAPWVYQVWNVLEAYNSSLCSIILPAGSFSLLRAQEEPPNLRWALRISDCFLVGPIKDASSSTTERNSDQVTVSLICIRSYYLYTVSNPPGRM